ncbi:MAG: hypothetical protein ACI97P_000863 [Arcticibacterium sp.]|jgi:hypothetical protein
MSLHQLESKRQIRMSKGDLITDAASCPHDINFPMDINLRSNAREKAEEFIAFLYEQTSVAKKWCSYAQIAKKTRLTIAQKNCKTRKKMHKEISKQVEYLQRNIRIKEFFWLARSEVDRFSVVRLAQEALQQIWSQFRWIEMDLETRPLIVAKT